MTSRTTSSTRRSQSQAGDGSVGGASRKRRHLSSRIRVHGVAPTFPRHRDACSTQTQTRGLATISAGILRTVEKYE